MARLKKSFDEALKKNAGDLGECLRSLSNTGETEAEPAAEMKGGPRNTAVSFTREEYEFIKEVFEQKAKGMKVATGVKMAALYIADRLDRGLITMSRAGINERR